MAISRTGYPVYTDGSCLNDNHGGYSFVVLTPDRKNVVRMVSGHVSNTTNNAMELMAIQQALIKIPTNHLVIHTDSQYSIDAVTKYYKAWQKNGWVNSFAQPVKNRDLIESIVELSKHKTIEYVKVKGHSGDPYNTVCDYLAKSAATTRGK